MTEELVLTRHRAWLEVKEAPPRILIAPIMLTVMDPDTTHLFGSTVVIQNGPDHRGGHVSYQIDGWNGYAMTAHLIEDTRPAAVEVLNLKPKGWD